MTFCQAINSAQSISLHYTDVFSLNINKRQAHELRKAQEWCHQSEWSYDDTSSWSLRDDGHLFLHLH
jgi:hypothetical protein